MIDAQLRDFFHQGLSILLGTRNERLEPNGARAAAVQAESDGLHFVLFVPAVAAADVPRDLEGNGQAAVVFCRVTDDRAIQVKGEFEGAREAGDAERDFVEEQWRRFLENLEHVGVPSSSVEHWTVWPTIAIRLRATALFDQTPGPRAGTTLA